MLYVPQQSTISMLQQVDNLVALARNNNVQNKVTNVRQTDKTITATQVVHLLEATENFNSIIQEINNRLQQMEGICNQNSGYKKRKFRDNNKRNQDSKHKRKEGTQHESIHN
jgi:hypothetical protein